METLPDTPAPDDAARATRAALPPAADGASVTSLGRYEIRRELGRGGMGFVYLAWDPELKREIALKLLPARAQANLEELQRFQREAEAAAKLSHPNVVATYDVGAVEGRHFLTMEVVRGGSVADRLRGEGRIAPALAMRWVREACDGMAHAHEHGIVHRDLKPENLLLDEHGRVKVSDFGLAHLAEETSTPRLTRSGQVLGTPTHMAPEQAEGTRGQVGPCSDVYALGSILYELVTGRPPYPSESPMEVLMAKISSDPPPPRGIRPEIAADVETLIQKAMERDPARRYATARELGDDLTRCLGGEAIHARPASAFYRARRWTRRNRGLAAGVAVAAVALLAGGGVAWREARDGAEAERAAAVARRAADDAERRAEERRTALVAQLRNVAAIAVTAILELRRKDVPAPPSFQAALERAFADTQREAPGLAEPFFHLGRMKRALDRPDEARSLQLQALARDARFAPAAYERAILAAGRYRAEIIAALRRREARPDRQEVLPADRGVSLDSLEQEDAELAARKREMLEAARGLAEIVQAEPAWRAHEVDLLRVGDAKLDCVNGLLAVHGSDGGQTARERLERALGGDPGLEEAYQALWMTGMVHQDYARAVEACTRGLAVDAGSLAHRRNRAEANLASANRENARGVDAAARFDAAVADLERVVEREPADVAAWIDLGGCRLNRAHAEEARGRDPEPWFHSAIQDLDRARKIDTRNPRLLWVSAAARLSWAHTLDQHGGDGGPLRDEAGRDLEAALAVDPHDADAWRASALVHHGRGLAAAARGQAPLLHYARAVEEFAAALRERPGFTDALRGRAIARLNWGNWVRRGGQGPEEHYRQAVEDLTEALRLNPADFFAWQTRGKVRTEWASQAVGAGGGEAEALFVEADRDLSRALECNPASAEGWRLRGVLRVNRASWLKRQRRDPRPDYEGAEADFSEAIARNSRSAEAWSTRGVVRIIFAVWREGEGEDPRAGYEAAAEDLTQAIERNPRSAEAWAERGRARAELGRWQTRQGEDPGTAFAAALEDLDRSLELNPAEPMPWRYRGYARLVWAGCKEKAGEDARTLYAAAAEDFAATLARNPRQADPVGKWLERAKAGAERRPEAGPARD